MKLLKIQFSWNAELRRFVKSYRCFEALSPLRTSIWWLIYPENGSADFLLKYRWVLTNKHCVTSEKTRIFIQKFEELRLQIFFFIDDGLSTTRSVKVGECSVWEISLTCKIFYLNSYICSTYWRVNEKVKCFVPCEVHIVSRLIPTRLLVVEVIGETAVIIV